MNHNRLSVGDYVVWKANANAKVVQHGFVCRLSRDMARMVVLLSDPDMIDKNHSLGDINLEVRGRNRGAVEPGEIPTNILEWPLHMVVLWYAATNYIMHRGFWDLGPAVDLCQRAARGKLKDKDLKKHLIERIRSSQKIAAMGIAARQKRRGRIVKYRQRGYNR